jgi:thiamine-phosphate pyrophosphorylase
VYLITDRRQLRSSGPATGIDALTRFVDDAVAAGVDLVQIREKDLSARDLTSLTSAVSRSAKGRCYVLVNDRSDVAVSCGAAGVHLTTRSLRPAVVRRVFGEHIIIGVSTHSVEEVRAAEMEGADFVVFGPVFETESKRSYGPPAGLGALREAVTCSGIAVLGLGGIKTSNFREVLDCGAAGIAGISLFIRPDDTISLPDLVTQIKAYKPGLRPAI